jgi:hypothetical protein
MATAKLDLPGSTMSWGYESELADKAVRKCVVTGAANKEEAITTAVTAAQSGGENLYSSMNIPLQTASCVRLGADRWLVDLQYARTMMSQRRNAGERRCAVTSLTDLNVPCYLKTDQRANGLPFVNISSNNLPAGTEWHRMQYVPGTTNGQGARLIPEPYNFRRPQFRISLSYTTETYTFGFDDAGRVGKVNNNTFFIPEIGGMFVAGELFYDGYGTAPRDISRFAATVNFRMVTGGFYEQAIKWNNGATYPNEKYWKVVNVPMYESVLF